MNNPQFRRTFSLVTEGLRTDTEGEDLFISSLNAAELLLPGMTWAGDCLVTHSNGRKELVRCVITIGAAQCGYGFKVSMKPAKKQRIRRPRPKKQ